MEPQEYNHARKLKQQQIVAVRVTLTVQKGQGVVRGQDGGHSPLGDAVLPVCWL